MLIFKLKIMLIYTENFGVQTAEGSLIVSGLAFIF